MKRILLLLLFSISIIVTYSQVYVAAGAMIKPYNKFGMGSNLDVGYRVGSSTFSIGYLHDIVNDKTLMNIRYGNVVYKNLLVTGGIAYADWSTDDIRKGYYTYVIGVEYFTMELFKRSRVYYGLDVSQNKVFLKAGFKYNF